MFRKIARPMLASVFVYEGVDNLRNTKKYVAETETFLKRVRAVVPAQYRAFVPQDGETVARAFGGTKIGAGSLLGLGKAPRLSAAALAITSLPSVIGAASSDSKAKDGEKSPLRASVLTSTALLGALILASEDTAGKPSLRWRAQQALPGKSESQKFAAEVSDRAADLGDKAGSWFDEASTKVADYIDDNKDDWREAGSSLLDTAKGYVSEAKSFVDDNKDEWIHAGSAAAAEAKDQSAAWLAQAQKHAKASRTSAVKAAAKAQKRAEKALDQLDTAEGKRAVKTATKKADKLQSQAEKAAHKAMKKVGKKVDF